MKRIQLLSPTERALRVLRDSLSPGQRADFAKTCWFNVRAANGMLWRVHGGRDRVFPNLVDYRGRGRSMILVCEFVPNPDLALAVKYHLEDPGFAVMIERQACKDRAIGMVPYAGTLAEHYRSFNEPEKGNRVGWGYLWR